MPPPRRRPAPRPPGPTRRCNWRVTAAQAGTRLDVFLRGWLPEALGRPLANASVRRLVLAGAVRIDGQPARRPAQPLEAGVHVEAVVRLDLLAEARREREQHVTLSEASLLFLDDALAALDKPAGLPMHPTADPARPDLVSLATRFLSERLGWDVRLGLHQRLDRDTSGVVLFTLDPAADAPLAAAFAARAVTKVYEALCHRPRHAVRESWSVSGELGPVGRGRAQRMGLVSEGGQASETRFRLLQDLGPALLVEARPLTGRKHQVRAHLAASGCPILGDELYSPGLRSPVAVERVMLHAQRLELRHPLTGAPLRLESPRPEDFAAALAALRPSA